MGIRHNFALGRASGIIVAMGVVGASVLIGCGHSQPPVSAMAPPVSGGQMSAPPVGGMGGMGGAPVGNAGMSGGGNAAMGAGGSVYSWQDVPAGQQVPITRGTFDQGGYQLYAASGETIVVPFVNQNLYVMRFGRSQQGQGYFINEGGVPTLYLGSGQFLENAAAQGARWYPIPDNYNYTRPMYVGLAPSWGEYLGMGWYPGMMSYGGMYGYGPYGGGGYNWMPGYYISIGGSRYNSYNSYRSYYNSTPGYTQMRTVYNNYPRPGSNGSFRSTSTFGGSHTGSFSGRPAGSSGSFGNGTGRTGFGGSSASSGMGSRPAMGSGSFGGSPGSGGSFGTRPASRPGSFGGGTSGFGGSSRPSGGSFGGSSRPSGGSFGGGGGHSFGGGGRRR